MNRVTSDTFIHLALGQRNPLGRLRPFARFASRFLWNERFEWPSVIPGGAEGHGALAHQLINAHEPLTTRDGQALQTYLNGLQTVERTRVMLASGALLRAWLVRTRKRCRDHGHTVGERLTRAVQEVAKVSVTAHEVRLPQPVHLFVDLHGAEYPRGAGLRLLRGVMNCDGIAYLLGELLAPDFETYVASVDGHRLVEVRLGGHSVYLDAQAAIPPFTLEPHIDGVGSYDDIRSTYANTHHYPDRVLPKRHYRKVQHRLHVPPLPEQQPWPPGVPLPPPRGSNGPKRGNRPLERLPRRAYRASIR